MWCYQPELRGRVYMPKSLIRLVFVAAFGLAAGYVYADYNEVLHPHPVGQSALTCQTAVTLGNTGPYKGALTCVSDWDGTPGICSSHGSGSIYTVAVFNGTNAWYCP